MKKILYLIVAGLLVLGLVLAGCGGTGQQEEEEEEEEPVVGDIVFEDGQIAIGVAGEAEHMTGMFQMLGATMGAGEINAAGGVDIGGVPHEIALVPIETGEATVDPLGSQGYSALLAKIDEVDAILAGFRTEALTVYREVAVGPDGAGVLFFDCGAATVTFCESVVDDYDNYKYFFKATPPNDYFLAESVARIVDSVGRAIREAGGFAEDYTLRAGIIADDAVWCGELPTLLEGLLAGYNFDVVAPPVLIDPLLVDPAQMGAALAPIAAGDPHVVIPVLSADAGVAFAGTRKVMMPSAMSVGINVPAQFKSPFAADLATPPTEGGPYVGYDIILDTWAEEVAATASTLAFLAAFSSYSGGEYPLYTAITYDFTKILAAVIEAEAWYDETAGVGYANSDDIIAWLEDPANMVTTTVGTAGYYPMPGTTSGGDPALTEAQVTALYPHIGTAGYPNYDAADWTVPPHAAHDLLYGPDYVFGIGAQWQWDADAGMWKKLGVWPREIAGADLKDQYGDWNFEFPGTKDLVLTPGVVKP